MSQGLSNLRSIPWDLSWGCWLRKKPSQNWADWCLLWDRPTQNRAEPGKKVLSEVSEWRKAKDMFTHQACKQLCDSLGPVLRSTKDVSTYSTWAWLLPATHTPWFSNTMTINLDKDETPPPPLCYPPSNSSIKPPKGSLRSLVSIWNTKQYIFSAKCSNQSYGDKLQEVKKVMGLKEGNIDWKEEQGNFCVSCLGEWLNRCTQLSSRLTNLDT